MFIDFVKGHFESKRFFLTIGLLIFGLIILACDIFIPGIDVSSEVYKAYFLMLGAGTGYNIADSIRASKK